MDTYNQTLKNYFSNPINLEQPTRQIIEKINSHKNIWILGNGGSASTAEHFATDLQFIKYPQIKQEIRSFALTANSSIISAISNDIGFDEIFSHQLFRMASPADLCILISASGRSQNLIRAIEVCKQKNISSLAILGFDGGALKSLADNLIHFETEIGSYAEVEDVHLSICHQISLKVRDHFLRES